MFNINPKDILFKDCRKQEVLSPTVKIVQRLILYPKVYKTLNVCNMKDYHQAEEDLMESGPKDFQENTNQNMDKNYKDKGDDMGMESRGNGLGMNDEMNYQYYGMNKKFKNYKLKDNNNNYRNINKNRENEEMNNNRRDNNQNMNYKYNNKYIKNINFIHNHSD